MAVRVVVSASDRYNWCLRPFAYLFNVYWSELQPVTVAGYTPPDFELPPNFTFFSIDRPGYPKERWSTGLIKYLRSIRDDVICLLLEDYWLRRTVDHQAVNSLADLMRANRDIFRIDLTTDRLYSGQMRDAGCYGRLDLVETPIGSPYQMSLQGCLVNRRYLLAMMPPDISPWEIELSGNTLIEAAEKRLGHPLRVLGTRQWPVRYTNGWGTDCRDGGYNLDGIDPRHAEHMIEAGWFGTRNRCK